MSEKIREVSQLSDATYAHTLVIESTYEYKVHGPNGFNFPCMVHVWISDLSGWIDSYHPRIGRVIRVGLTR